MLAAPQVDFASVTARLDAFIAQNVNANKTHLLLQYLGTRPPDVQLSSLLMSELMYLHFVENACPLLYDSQLEVWYVFDKKWQESADGTCSAPSSPNWFPPSQ